MPSAASASTGSEPEQPKQDEVVETDNWGVTKGRLGSSQSPIHRLRWRIDGTGSMGAKKHGAIHHLT
jgi:hypothetical protein